MQRSSASLFQQASQPLAHITVQRCKHMGHAVLVILIPAAQAPVDSADDFLPSPSLVALRVAAQCFSDFLQALLPRPSSAALEVVAQEVKASALHTRIGEARLVGVELESGFAHPRAHRCQSLFGLGSAAAEDDEVVRVAHHLPACRRHLVVERVEINVGQQRADDITLGRAAFGGLQPRVSSSTPARRKLSTSASTRPSATRCLTSARSRSCGMVSK